MNRDRSAFNLLRDALTRTGSYLQISAHSSDGWHLTSVNISDRNLYVAFQLEVQDQQTVVLYRDERTELVIEQRPVRPRRRVNDAEPTEKKDGAE